MAIVAGDYIASPVPNTTLREYLRDGELYCYMIAPIEGYLLHDKDLDMPELNENFMETGNMIPWFTGGETTVLKNYDFTTTTQSEYKYTDENGNEITMPVTMIGAREFYTVPSSIVPGKRRLGDDHEMEGEMNDN